MPSDHTANAPVAGVTSRWASAVTDSPLSLKLLSLALLFAIWELAARTNFNWAFPGFLDTMAALWEMIADGSMGAAYLRTLEPLLIGLVMFMSGSLIGLSSQGGKA